MQSMIGHSLTTSESWKNLPWKKFRKELFRLQKRVYEAVRVGDKRKARSLQKLILKSKAARFLAIRQVTQLNAGKKTAGVDGKASLTMEERFALEKFLKINVNTWKHQDLRQIPIPKKDGTTRMLKVPTIADRAWQCIAKFALEPAHEATFHAQSYGFRTGRSAQDAQRILFNNLNSFTVVELQAIIAAFANNPYYAHYTEFVIFLANTACRFGEAAGLKWSSLGADYSTAWIGESVSRGYQNAKGTKTGKSRTIQLSPIMRSMLLARYERINPQPDDLVFPSPKGLPLIVSSQSLDLKKPWRFRHCISELTELNSSFDKLCNRKELIERQN